MNRWPSVILFLIVPVILLSPVIYLVLNVNIGEDKQELTSKVKRSIPIEKELSKNILCEPSNKHQSICLTKDCALTAATLISAMDFTVDPCDDFYKFSCGNFIRKNLVPEDQDHITTFMQYKNNYLLQQKNLIENYNSYGEPDVVFRLQEAYHVCINKSIDHEKELDAFRDFVTEVLGGWPMAIGDKWKSKHERIEDHLIDLYKANMDHPFFQITLSEINMTSTSNIKENCLLFDLQFSNSNINSIKAYKNLNLTNEETENKPTDEDIANKNFFIKILKLIGKYDVNVVQQDIEDVFEFIDYIDEKTSQKNYEYSKKLMNIEEINNFMNGTVDWLKILNAKSSENISLSDEMLVNNIEAAALFVEMVNQFPPRVVRNAETWMMLFSELFNDIYFPGAEKEFDDVKIARGRKIKKVPEWRKCLDWITETYPLVLTRMFVKTFVGEKSKTSVDEIIQLVDEAYKKQIQDSQWLDEETKERALRKADAIRRFVGYPDLIFNDIAIEEEYNYIPTVKSTYFENVLLVNHLAFQKKLEIIFGNATDKWFQSPLVINAFYFSRGNSIWFPSGILQLPFYAENRMAAVNFGMIGHIIGHEIGHAFDASGRHYDETGQYESWWSNKTDILYKERENCFIDQYSNYCPEELETGNEEEKICIPYFTVGENMADNTGLTAAYDAYKLWIQKHGEEKKLPGLLEYSPDQLFFISFAYLWCENVPADKWVNLYTDDPHSAGKYRIWGSVSNNENFRKAFNCPLGNMNRGNQSCVLW